MSNLILSNEEIEEELVNNELLSSNTVENDTTLNKMSLEEKKVLLRKIKQSEESKNESSSILNHPELEETSISKVPSLSVSGNSEKKLKLPRTPLPKTMPNGDSQNQNKNVKFNLPNCRDDGALPLPMPDRCIQYLRKPYCVMKGETPSAALRRMLADHDQWKDAYIIELSRVEILTIEKDLYDSDSKEESLSPILGDNDIFYVGTKESAPNNKVNSDQRKIETTDITSNETITKNGCKTRTIQRHISRDSDCEEIEPILKPRETNLGDWIQAPKQKTNRKCLNNKEKAKSVEEVTEVEFDFDKKWKGQSQWQRNETHSVNSQNNRVQTRRNLSKISEVQEKMVECPICQKSFPQSKIENHAAACEGFSDSSMDVEEP